MEKRDGIMASATIDMQYDRILELEKRIEELEKYKRRVCEPDMDAADEWDKHLADLNEENRQLRTRCEEYESDVARYKLHLESAEKSALANKQRCEELEKDLKWYMQLWQDTDVDFKKWLHRCEELEQENAECREAVELSTKVMEGTAQTILNAHSAGLAEGQVKIAELTERNKELQNIRNMHSETRRKALERARTEGRRQALEEAREIVMEHEVCGGYKDAFIDICNEIGERIENGR